MLVGATAVLLLGSQSLHTAAPAPVRAGVHPPLFPGWPPLKQALPALATVVPGERDRKAAGRLLDELRALPGPLFIPFHTYYAVLAGKQPFVHRMGVRDVEAALGRPKGLDAALESQYFAAIVLDWKSFPGEWPHADRRYHVLRQFTEGVDSVRMFAGAQTSPRQLLVPTREAPALPAGGQRLFDFERGDFQGFSVEGTAFGSAPGPAPFGLYGLYAADSGRNGAAGRGILRSAPFVVEAAHLRFALSGPADPELRVSLREGERVAASATPSGVARLEEWNTSDLVGKTVELVIEDNSTQGALAVDEVVTY
jgi:hypothetical protein